MREWYERYVIEPTLASLEEFQERDSGWALSRILNLTVNVNKLDPMHAGCHFEVPRDSDETSGGDKKEKHVNVLYLQDPHNDGVGYFAWIKDLSRLVRSQLTGNKNKIFFCDREDCQNLNDCAIRLPNGDDRWLEFDNHNNIERVPFIVYADLECVLRKTEPNKEDASSYEYQRHEVFSIGYYVRCSYDNSLSSYHFQRDENCISWTPHKPMGSGPRLNSLKLMYVVVLNVLMKSLHGHKA
ncbi:PREDICTED: uncharacterized protein LOC108768373 [Trachymyrmex cornetzi]|uniref:uncharacterized protein LOC108768373 n=1 Tax=Trachymyrmex cornetzi TaxID=471704 RepID=UPI00084F394E|nr:PREDICTED: uncharacterized protein LOC108768373 [Trachymyrmex cornetzi]